MLRCMTEAEMTLESFIGEVDLVLAETTDEHEITKRVAGLLSALFESGYRLPAEFTRPAAERHVNYPLHVAPDHS